MSERSFNFPKPFQLQQESRSRQPSSSTNPRGAPSLPLIEESLEEHAPVLIASKGPTSTFGRSTGQQLPSQDLNYQLLKPKDLQDFRKLEEMANMGLDDLLEDKHLGQVERPAQFIQRGEYEDREMALKLQLLVDELKKHKEQLRSLRKKNMELTESNHERAQEFEKVKYEKEMLEEELKNSENQPVSPAKGMPTANRKAKGEDEERRRNERMRELLMGTDLVGGDFAELIGKQEKELNVCEKLFTKLRTCFHAMTVLRTDLRSIEAHYDKSIGAYFSFFRFLVNSSIFIFLLSAALIALHSWESEALEDSCEEGVLCWLFYSSFAQDEAFAYSATLMAIMSFTVAAGVYRWVKTDYVRVRAEVYGGGDAKVKKFAALVFNPWDWTLSTAADTNDHTANISTQVTTGLREKAREKEANSRTLAQRAAIRTKRIIGWAVYVVFLMIGWTLITLLIVGENEIKSSLSADNIYLNLPVLFLPKFGVSMVNAFFPAATMKITAVEDWDTDRTVVKIQIIRMYLAKILNVLLFAALNLQYAANEVWFYEGFEIEEIKGYSCRENQVGVNLFLLVISEALVSKLIPLQMAALHKAIGKCRKLTVWKKEIKVAQQVINVIYFQGLVWICFPFFPYIAVLSPILLYLDFKFQYWRLRHLQVKPQAQTQASDIALFIMRIYNITMLAMIAFIGYFLTRELTHECGPFKSEVAAKDNVITEMTNRNILKELWLWGFDYAPTFWVLTVALLAAYLFKRNHSKVLRSYQQVREEEFVLMKNDLTATINRLKKQAELNKKVMKFGKQG